MQKLNNCAATLIKLATLVNITLFWNLQLLKAQIQSFNYKSGQKVHWHMHINWNFGLQQFALPFPSSSSYIPSRRVITFNSILSCSFCFLSLSWLSLYSSGGIAGSAAARFLSAINSPTDGTSVYFSVVISTLPTLSLLRGRWSLKKGVFPPMCR